MRWCLVDRLVFLPDGSACGRGAVSLEQYLLHELLGRDGALPESLLVAMAVEVARHAVERLSGFTHSAVLDAIEFYRFLQPAGPGAVVDTVCTQDGDVTFSVQQTVAGIRIAEGRIVLSRLILEAVIDPLVAREDAEVLCGPFA